MANYNTGGMSPAEVYDAHACGLPYRQPALGAADRSASLEKNR